eukprot:m.226153 g.226153  ORF g.226153 m.226153 type:complete len:541 (-) comp18790_c1_seq1:234-1856(-)
MASSCLGLLAVLLAVGGAVGHPPRVQTVSEATMYHVAHINLTTEARSGVNPFLVNITATITPPSFSTSPTPPLVRRATAPLSVPGFFYSEDDGSGQWVFAFRFSCDAVGSWAWHITSDDADLNNMGGAVNCEQNSDPAFHGRLEVDQSHPHHFAYQDGTRYFMVGTEVDWLWALDLDNLSTHTLEPFLDTLSYGGFNNIMVNLYANYSAWARKVPSPPNVGNTVNTPWGSDYLHLNLRFWNHYDDVMAALERRGIVAHIMIMVENKAVQWPQEQSVADDLYWKTTVARLQAFNNIVWDVSKEAQRLSDSYWASRFPFLVKYDAHNHIRTMHSHWNASLELKHKYCNMISAQQHSVYHEHILAVRKAFPTYPVANVEFLYEEGPVKTYGVQSEAIDMLPVWWSLYMAGGYGVWYYSAVAWDVIIPNLVPPGYGFTRVLRDFFVQTTFWQLEPHDELVQVSTDQGSKIVAYALASPGKEYVVFTNASSFSLKDVPSGLKGVWTDPESGQTLPATSTAVSGNAQQFEKPTEYGPFMVLHLTSA